MKLKNILTIGVILFTAFTAQAGLIIENPYVNVFVKHEWQMEYEGIFFPAMSATQNGNINTPNDINMPRADISIIVNKFTLPLKQFSSNHPLKGQYQEQFSYNNKSGQIMYTIDAILGEKDGKKVIKSIHVKILHASLNGVELHKNGVQGITQSEL